MEKDYYEQSQDCKYLGWNNTCNIKLKPEEENCKFSITKKTDNCGDIEYCKRWEILEQREEHIELLKEIETELIQVELKTRIIEKNNV